MDKLNQEFAKMDSESSMAAKASTESFADLKAQASSDWKAMTADYQKFTAALKAGDADAAKSAEQDWHTATQKFQQDWDLAKAKAQQDMQQIKSTADQISSEISSVLNNAISGKLNWKQEFDQILEKMLSSLLKHLSEMIAAWVANAAQTKAIQGAEATEGLALQKSANAAAGTSDAITAAKGAYSSAAQIPYIGWIIAPIAGAAAFAGVEAFGSAAGGASIPPGVNPLMQLHERELVLPAEHADTIRSMKGGGGNGGTNNVNSTFNIQSLDPSSLHNIVMRNPHIFAGAVASYLRGGGSANIG
jgi:hypothetical protein